VLKARVRPAGQEQNHAMKEVRVQSWSQFNDYIATRDGWAFRGQTDAAWPLLSALSRRLLQNDVPPEHWRQREERAIRIFRRKAHVYLPDKSALDDDLRCLAMMQHHGAPTRLLDFTKSPFVAAFFALEKARGVAAVYALNTPRIWVAAPDFDPSLTRDAIDPRVPGNFERHFAVNKLPVVWYGEPRQMDRRLVAQSGLLVVPGVLDQPLDVLLEGYAQEHVLVERVLIGPEVRAEAMHELYRMNITQATLFPDLEGLARSISYELEENWPPVQPER
jgi:hypothetical protein